MQAHPHPLVLCLNNHMEDLGATTSAQPPLDITGR